MYNFKFTDKIIEQIRLEIIKAFENNKPLEFTTAEAYKTSKKIYDQIKKKTLELYYKLYKYYYDLDLEELEDSEVLDSLDIDYEEPENISLKDTKKEVDKLLLGVSALTMYSFVKEWERKQGRFADTISIPETANREYEKQIKVINRQLTTYANILTTKAVLKKYEDSGIERVVWETEEDDRVCDECWKLNNKVFDIDKVPEAPHPNCRCIVRIYSGRRLKKTVKPLEDITDEWLKQNKSNGEVKYAKGLVVNGELKPVDNKNIIFDNNKSELLVAENLSNKQGIKVEIMPRATGNINGVKSFDFRLNGTPFELKNCFNEKLNKYVQPKTKNIEKYFFYKIKNAGKQAENYILDITNTGFTNSDMNKQLIKIITDTDTNYCKTIMVYNDGDILKVYKNKK